MSTTGLKRSGLDKFYTNEDVAKLCADAFAKYVIYGDLVIEPSAGAGVFIPFIKQLTDNYSFIDIKPEHDEIVCDDFLSRSVVGSAHIFGNPPYGSNASLAIKFIKKASVMAKTIGFILPKSFKKPSRHTAFPLNFHLDFQMDIPDNGFTIDGKIHNVPCVFQIWIKRDHDRQKTIKNDPKGWAFVKRDQMPDFAIRRVGVYAGKLIFDDIQTKSVQSHYFIKVDDDVKFPYDAAFIFDDNNTVGPKSISKQEVVTVFNKFL